MSMDKLYKQAAERMIQELSNEQNRCVIEKDVLDPMVKYIGHQLYPYVISASIVLIVVLALLLYLAYLSVRMHRLHHA